MDITQDPEYIRGYEKYLQQSKKMEEKSKTPYMQGFLAASKDLAHQEALAMEAEMDAEGFEFQEDTIKKLQQEVKELDERLKKLEKYIKE
jgi:hypothetical protein